MMNRKLKEWLIILALLADDIAIAFIVLLILGLLNVTVTLPVVIILAVFLVGLTLVLHRLVIPALRRKKASGAESMVGLEGEVMDALKPAGLVKVKGEYWKAQAIAGDIDEGEKVEVVGVERLVLKVKRKESAK